MEDKKQNSFPANEDFLMDEPPLLEEPIGEMPELSLLAESPAENYAAPESTGTSPFILTEHTIVTSEDAAELDEGYPDEPPLPSILDDDDLMLDTMDYFTPEPVPQITGRLPKIPMDAGQDLTENTDTEDVLSDIPALLGEEPAQQEEEAALPEAVSQEPEQPKAEPVSPPPPALKKGRPKRKKGYGFFGIPHLLATVVWLAIIVTIGTSLGRMIWVCAADVLAFGRESKKVSITITANDSITEIADTLHEAGLVRYPGLFKLYASIAVDEGDILPGTFELDTLYDYHALVVQMGPRSSTRTVVEDLLIPEGLNCRQIFELLEEKNICTVKALEEYAASGEFSDFWFLEGVERGDRYCLEGFLFPDTYDFYSGSTPREALGKMLLGFEARVDKDETLAALNALNERLSSMMRANGCSEEHIAENMLDLRDLLTVASLIEEETASSAESPLIASVIFNRYTQDQVYERYLGIDAAIIYATGSSSNIDTSLDHPYNTYKNPGLTPGPISNPGLETISAALNFQDSPYYYYVLNPETQVHQFSKTLEEHEKWIEEFKNYDGGDEQ